MDKLHDWSSAKLPGHLRLGDSMGPNAATYRYLQHLWRCHLGPRWATDPLPGSHDCLQSQGHIVAPQRLEGRKWLQFKVDKIGGRGLCLLGHFQGPGDAASTASSWSKTDACLCIRSNFKINTSRIWMEWFCKLAVSCPWGRLLSCPLAFRQHPTWVSP